MLVNVKFYKIKFNNILYFFFLFIFLNNNAYANFQEQLLSKYSKINTLSFDFTQKIGEKVEFGNCYIKYPLKIKCNYPKKKKYIVSNGKKFAIVKKRYKKIYFYPLKKTPLFYLLKKENILNLIQNNKPTNIKDNIAEYELINNNLSKIKIFFNIKSLEFLGWKTIDAYSNEVTFLIRNIKENIVIENNNFIIPNEENL